LRVRGGLAFISAEVPAEMNIASAIFGLILLLFGRRLFWLFVAAAGFAAGMFIARDQLQLHSTWMVFAIALFAGLLGALLSVVLQKLAIAIAGFAAGGYLCAFVLMRMNLEKFAWVAFLVGGILGTILMLAVFEWALIILSSLIGAAFLADGIGTEQNALMIFGVAFVIGLVIQRLQMQSAKRTEGRAEK
jgi:hypothetical protein